jgi:hypothetical protein
MGDVGSKTTFPCGVVDEVDLLNSNSKSGPRDHSYSWGVRQKAGGEHYPGSRFEVQCARFNLSKIEAVRRNYYSIMGDVVAYVNLRKATTDY